MSKAEEHIRKNTNQFSNEDGFDYIPWLTPDQARKAVEIAREEIYSWLEENASKYMKKQDTMFGTIKVLNSYKLANDLKQAMKDE